MTTSANTARLKQLDIDHMLHPRTNLRQQAQDGPGIIFEKGDGVRVWDTDGKEYIEAFSGLWCVNVGWGRSALAQVAKQQIEDMAYAPTFYGLATPPAIELAARLAQIYPGPINHFQFTSGGAESNETAIKIARYYWSIQGQEKKVKIISRMMGYHGIAMGALSATGIPAFWQHFGPRPAGFMHLSPPYTFRRQEDLDEDGFVQLLVDELEQTIEDEGADTIAAMIGEPIMGGGGVVVPPDRYWSAIKAVLDRHNILLIADEVITGFGRTGTMFGVQQYNVQPDIVAIAKGITSGYIPLGAVGVSDTIYEQMLEPDAMFMHGFTYSGHPVGCAVGLANIDIIENEKLPENAKDVGAYLMSRLEELLGHQNVGEVRGKGLMMIVELVKDKRSREPLTGIVGPLLAATRKRGLIVSASDMGVSLSPPLILTRGDADQIVDRLQGAIVEVFG